MSSATTLRIATAGSVDDGRAPDRSMLYDTKTVFEDQLLGREQPPLRRWRAQLCAVDLRLRQSAAGITIDVAHRYYHAERSFTADTPGHAQYTQHGHGA